MAELGFEPKPRKAVYSRILQHQGRNSSVQTQDKWFLPNLHGKTMKPDSVGNRHNAGEYHLAQFCRRGIAMPMEVTNAHALLTHQFHYVDETHSTDVFALVRKGTCFGFLTAALFMMAIIIKLTCHSLG